MAIEEITTDNQGSSPDLIAETVEALKSLFPEIVVDGKVDASVLLQLLGAEVEDSEEKFGLYWHGKRRSRQLALTPSTGTLRPVPGDSVEWDTTQHLMIEGDNLEVLKLLQKSYAGRVKLIYIDPPYNTGNDFVYKDDFKDNIANYMAVTGQAEEGKKVSTNTESSGRFHTDWLNMMYPRLKLARNLLRDDGVIFISIDDAEEANLTELCGEIFGEWNFLSNFVRRRRMATGMRGNPVSPDHEYLVAFAKNIERVQLFGFAKSEEDFPFTDSQGRFRSTDLTVGMTRSMRPNQFYSLVHPDTGNQYWPSEQRVWRFEPSTMDDHISRDKIIWPEDNPEGKMTRPRFKTRFEPASQSSNPVSTWIEVRRKSVDQKGFTAGLNQEGTKELRELMGDQVLEYPKPVSLLEGLCSLSTRGCDIVLDFFAGSGTIGHAVMAQNAEDGGDRRYILVQLPEPLDPENKDQKVAAEFCDRIGKPRTIAELTKERLRRAADKIREEHPDYEGDLGFRVFKLDSSNIRAWDPQPENLEDTLLDHVDHLKENRSEQDVLYELLLKLGLDLCVPIETNTIADKTVHSIGAGTLFACLDETIEAAKAEDLALGIVDWRNQLDPAGDTTVVFRDSAFPDDVTKTNLDAILKQHNITTVRSI